MDYLSSAVWWRSRRNRPAGWLWAKWLGRSSGLLLATSVASFGSTVVHRAWDVQWRTPALVATTVTATELAEWRAEFQPRVFMASTGPVPYRILRPTRSSPRPLVLVLHGSGAMGTDNAAQLGAFGASWARLELAEDLPIVVIPQVSQRSADYDVPGREQVVESRPGPSLRSLIELVDTLAADPSVDRGRIYVVGFSMGASAALQVALVRPQLFAGAYLFAPVPPPLSRAGELRHLRLTIVHGDADTENPFSVSLAWTRALAELGGRPRFFAYRGLGHAIPEELLTDRSWRKELTGRAAARGGSSSSVR